MARRVIVLRGQPIYNEDGVAQVAITPGHMLAGVSSLTLHGAATPGRVFALERDERGQDIDDAYASGDTVKAGAFHGGQVVYAWLASGDNVAEDAALEAAAAGEVTALAAGVQVGRALEAVNNAAGGTGPNNSMRIRVEVN